MIFDRLKNLLSKKEAPGPAALRDLPTLVQEFVQPALQIMKTDQPTRSHFGGEPNLPATISWPKYKGKELDFVARISLPELHATHEVRWLPATGSLLFFYDIEEQPWSSAPGEERGFSVIFCTEESDMPSSKSEKSSLPHHFIHFKRIASLPSDQRQCIEELELNEAELESYWNFSDAAFGKEPRHQISGFPYSIQNDDMEVECEQNSGGNTRPSHKDKKAYRAAMREASANWRLLFQIDSDDELDVMWGDVGMLYFWVRENEAKVGIFDNAMAIMACH